MGSGSAAESAPAAHIIAGRYRVESALGQGGIGMVYAVTDLTHGSRVALKRLTAGASATTAQLFEREYHTLAGLRHPCIVEVYEYGSDADGPFYTMEVIEGRDLGHAAPMPWRDACRDLRDVAAILGLLHARRLLHRDLSPRNLLRSANGRLKLIDFGAVARFGASTEVVGTPPLVPPEAVQREALDQRADLYTLGALAYWLLTGVHAYPARYLDELPGQWRRPLAPPSSLAALHDADATSPPIPAALDALIASLLRVDPAERIGNTAELIDRLNTIAELPPTSDELTVQSYLESKAFVGRAEESRQALDLLRQADRGNVQTLLVEGPRGVGRTRFVEELVVMSRLAGALPVVAAEIAVRPYAVAETWLLSLLRTLRSQTLAAAAEHAGLLGAVSKELRAQLGVEPRPSTRQLQEAHRVRVLAAFRDVFLALAREHLLAFVVDDLHAIDDESQALLTALAHADSGHRMWLVATIAPEPASSSPAIANLRARATCIVLAPFTAAETRELLRSMFGQAPYLERLAERLQRVTGGNVAHLFELARYLVQCHSARYLDGAWSLPVELVPENLPKSRRDVHVARIERLSPDARSLARRLSVMQTGSLTHDQCLALSDLPPGRVHELLDELTREGALRPTADGHRFAHEDIQYELHTELDEAERRLSHARLGEQLAARDDDDIHGHLRACVHFLRAQDGQRASQQLRAVHKFYARGEMHTLRSTAPLLEEVYLLLHEQKRGADDMAGVLALLTYAGYYADRVYASRYGDRAIDLQRRLLCLHLTPWLSRVLGGKLALVSALTLAGVARRFRSPNAPPFKAQLRMYFGTVSALTGTAAICIDVDRGKRHGDALRPFGVLGRGHAADLAYRCAINNTRHLGDRPASAHAHVLAMRDRLLSDEPIVDLHKTTRVGYLAGCYSLLGAMEVWCDGPDCLQTADRLEQFGPMQAMNADHLRSAYYAGQGDTQRAEYYRQRMEVHAVQLGSAWQVETWAPADAIRIALRINDASLLKRAVQQIERLSGEVPSLLRILPAARGAYLLLHRKYEQAIPFLTTDVLYEGQLTWTRQRGLLARAHNGLGQHAEAKQVCVQALRLVEEDDLRFVMINLNVQVELALAEAGLGNFVDARRQLDGLMARHAPNQSAITLGSLHHARARVALLERDLPTARAHHAQMDAHYRATGVATLIELSTELARELGALLGPSAEESVVLREHARSLSRIKVRLAQRTTLGERADEALAIVLALSAAESGFVLLSQHGERPVARPSDHTPAPEVLQWAMGSMHSGVDDDQTVVTSEVVAQIETASLTHDRMRWCALPLRPDQRGAQRISCTLVLGFIGDHSRLPEPAIVRAIAQCLIEGAGLS